MAEICGAAERKRAPSLLKNRRFTKILTQRHKDKGKKDFLCTLCEVFFSVKEKMRAELLNAYYSAPSCSSPGFFLVVPSPKAEKQCDANDGRDGNERQFSKTITTIMPLVAD